MRTGIITTSLVLMSLFVAGFQHGHVFARALGFIWS